MRTIKFLAIVTIEVEIIRLVKVRAYKRVRRDCRLMFSI